MSKLIDQADPPSQPGGERSTAQASAAPTSAAPPTVTVQDTGDPDRPFQGWRLLRVVGAVIVVLAVVSALVDWLVIGPLEGRVF